MKFSDIPGQTRIKNHLIQTVKNNRVSHAQLFTGPSGSGKLALAIAFAQYISCTNRQHFETGTLKGDSCGVCPSCVKYAKIAHPDLHFYFPVAPTKEFKKPVSKDFMNVWREFLLKNNFLVDTAGWYEAMQLENKQGLINAEDCNDMIQKLAYKSYESEYKIVIIWHADKMFHAAAPKILKILEEPPDKTLFILIAEQTDKMLNTILSRSQILKINKLSEREVAEVLMAKFQLSEAEARKLALLSDGDLKLAIDLVGERDTEEYHFRTLQDWLRLCFKKDIVGIAQFTEDIAKIGRERQKSLLSYGLRIIRRCLLINFRLESLVKLEGEELKFVTNLAPYINPANAPVMAEEFNKAIFHIERNVNGKILFMDLSLTLVKLMKIKA